MRLVASVLILLLLLIGCDHHRHAETHQLPTKEALSAIVVGHFQAIERNSHEGAMSYFHNQAPERVRIDEQLKLTMSGYLQTIGTLTFSNVSRQDKYAVLQATHSFMIISGVKFIYRTEETTYRFAREEGIWKIWSMQVR